MSILILSTLYDLLITINETDPSIISIGANILEINKQFASFTSFAYY